MIRDIIHGDCFEAMKNIPSNSVDMVFADLPYNTIDAKWDKDIIDLHELKNQYARIGKINCTYVLTCQKKFTFKIGSFFSDWFRHRWIWHKDKCANFQCAKAMPLAETEDVLIFNRSGFMRSWNDPGVKPKGIYNPIMRAGRGGSREKSLGKKRKKGEFVCSDIKAGRTDTSVMSENDSSKQRYPTEILYFPIPNRTERAHPTQKPVALVEYMIKTYTNEEMLVVDNCAGSGTTAVACENLNRQYIVIEKEKKYIPLIHDRVKRAKEDMLTNKFYSTNQLKMF